MRTIRWGKANPPLCSRGRGPDVSSLFIRESLQNCLLVLCWARPKSRSLFYVRDLFGPLAVQFSAALLFLNNEQGKTVHQVWDGSHLKLTFRRNFSSTLMQQWYDLESIATNIIFTIDIDDLLWQYESAGVYSSSSLYALINFEGVTPMFIPTVWKLYISHLECTFFLAFISQQAYD
jgi:hypothetical protein